MDINKCIKNSFSVIGREGSTNDSVDFIAKLWQDAEAHFTQADACVKKDENGMPVGYWGAMSDLSRSFLPWEDNFSKGLYLAGFEALDDAVPPDGWTKWVIPSYEYIVVKNSGYETFLELIEYMKSNDIELVGAVHDHTDPKDGQAYLYAPIRKM